MEIYAGFHNVYTVLRNPYHNNAHRSLVNTHEAVSVTSEFKKSRNKCDVSEEHIPPLPFSD